MIRFLLSASAAAFIAGPALAANLLTNGDFETGDLSGWSLTVNPSSFGTGGIYANGANAPTSGNSTATNPTGGSFVYLTGQGGAGAYELRQAFTLASATTITIKFDHFANDYSGTVFTGNGLDPFLGDPVQLALVDLIDASTPSFGTGGVLQTFYSGADAGANPNPWTSYSFTTTLAAGSYAIRFVEADNQLFFTQGVDNVFVGSAVPEAASWAMLIAGFGLVGAAMRRRVVAAA
ncbi:PEPxxWA-CTERM sorting domain-containing protein [Sandarakinorhabdus sp. DWP1-3-1]|uniref:PEPxxWA-CTERM sorting domain-containing protein n=1 Tax=Sandarakinorhabdus sp. DWP1-3-1 TaxID=2804627 RepID=UPI003CEF21A8